MLTDLRSISAAGGKKWREGRRNPARRWVVERTFAWLKGFRSLRTRYCCYLVNFMGLLYLALACILWRNWHSKVYAGHSLRREYEKGHHDRP